MTAPAIRPGYQIPCTTCEGRGERFTGKREHDTNAPITATCTDCAGTGYRPMAVDWEADDEAAWLHIGDTTVTFDQLDPHDPDSFYATALIVDTIAQQASDLADELRSIGRGICEECRGYGDIGHDDPRLDGRDCLVCGGSGRVA